MKPYIKYWDNGNIRSKSWLFNDEYHRADGPALIWYYESSVIQRELYHINNNCHRVDGPADIWYYESGEVTREQWYLNGNQSNHKEWLIEHNLYKPYNTWTDEEKVLWELTWK